MNIAILRTKKPATERQFYWVDFTLEDGRKFSTHTFTRIANCRRLAKRYGAVLQEDSQE